MAYVPAAASTSHMLLTGSPRSKATTPRLQAAMQASPIQIKRQRNCIDKAFYRAASLSTVKSRRPSSSYSGEAEYAGPGSCCRRVLVRYDDLGGIRNNHMLVPMVVEQTSRGERAFDIYSRLLKEN